MAKQAAPKGDYVGKRGLYKVAGEKAQRERKACPKCGPGIFMAVHKDRTHCGNCGYTEFGKK